MTSAELKYLIAIEELYDGINGVKLTDIAAKVNVSKVSVYRAVERMDKNGHVERNDKNKVVLTDLGKKELIVYKKTLCFFEEQLEKICDISKDVAYADSLCLACALSDISREKILNLKMK